MEKHPKISIIILTYNAWRHISNCLESVFKSTYSNYEVIVVDNNSKDGTPDLIKEKFPKVKLILNDKNYGFTGGNNCGIKEAKGDFILLLNDDTIIHQDLVANLSKELAFFNIGIVGPKIYFMEGLSGKSDRIWFAGGVIDWRAGLSYHIGRNLTDKDLKNDIKKEVDFITGCALMIKREVIDKIGLLDDKFFAFYEDADWCQKAKKAGYRVIYVPFGGMWHIKSATASYVFLDDLKQLLNNNKNSKLLIYLRMTWRYIANSCKHKYRVYRNQFIFFMRHAPFKYKLTFLIKFIVVLTPRFLINIFLKTPLSLIKIYKKNVSK